MSSLDSVQVEISVVVGRSTIPIQRLLRMGRGAVIELDCSQGDSVLVLANNRPVARAEIEVAGDRVRVRIRDLVPSG